MAYINDKENQRFKEGVQIYEDLLAWVNKSTEELKKSEQKFGLTALLIKSSRPNPEQRKRALISGYRESPEGSAIQDKVLNVINRDYDGLVAYGKKALAKSRAFFIKSLNQASLKTRSPQLSTPQRATFLCEICQIYDDSMLMGKIKSLFHHLSCLIIRIFN